ncbi:MULTISPECIES: roadblock/LC7 domain-containing protein [Streptomyces]|uniref:Roadblock/LC7 domain-containing protein n=1 Tax=Streptomyces pratisoli TaxID=3139917 RepID=A0ACC6QAN5_9ACTN|nr:roadblock/LC7 domain-containing protein [Streptomyces sp. NBC_00259]
MTGAITRLPDLGWMLRPLTEIPGVRHAVVVSEDGLRLGHDSAENLTGPVTRLGVPEAESLSAACAAMTMTGRSTAALLFGGGAGVRQLMLESEHGFVLFTHAGAGAHLAVATDTEADVGLVAQQMQVLVAKIGAHLSTQPREPASPSS